MKVRVESRDVGRLRSDLLAVMIPKIDSEKRRVATRLQGVDRLLGGQLRQVVESGDFRGKAGESLLLFPNGESETRRVLLLGVGADAELKAETLRRAAGSAVSQARAKSVANPTLQLYHTRRLSSADAAQACAEGAVLAAYRSDGWKTKREQNGDEVESARKCGTK